MPNVAGSSPESEIKSTAQYVSTPSNDRHDAVDLALDYHLKPNAGVTTSVPTPGAIFMVAPNVNNETLLVHACESLASASVMATEFAGMLEGVNRNAMLALQQVIMLSELAVSQVLDNVGSLRTAKANP